MNNRKTKKIARSRVNASGRKPRLRSTAYDDAFKTMVNDCSVSGKYFTSVFFPLVLIYC